MMSDLLLNGIRTIKEAGRLVLNIYNSNFGIEYKEDKSPITEADLASQDVFFRFLKETKIPIISEEMSIPDFEMRKKWEDVWLLDPLDGTKEFVKKNGEFTLNLALVHRGNPILGLVLVPVNAELYFSLKGQGAFCLQDVFSHSFSNLKMEEIYQLSRRLPESHSDRPFTVVGSRSHMNEATNAYIESLRSQHPDLVFASHGSSKKLCVLAEGSADLYPRLGPCMEWDTAAGHAILLESGGSCKIHPDGQELQYNKEKLLNPSFIAYGSVRNL